MLANDPILTLSVVVLNFLVGEVTSSLGTDWIFCVGLCVISLIFQVWNQRGVLLESISCCDLAEEHCSRKANYTNKLMYYAPEFTYC